MSCSPRVVVWSERRERVAGHLGSAAIRVRSVVARAARPYAGAGTADARIRPSGIPNKIPHAPRPIGPVTRFCGAVARCSRRRDNGAQWTLERIRLDRLCCGGTGSIESTPYEITPPATERSPPFPPNVVSVTARAIPRAVACLSPLETLGSTLKPRRARVEHPRPHRGGGASLNPRLALSSGIDLTARHRVTCR
jgi:hypothetical protein